MREKTIDKKMTDKGGSAIKEGLAWKRVDG